MSGGVRGINSFGYGIMRGVVPDELVVSSADGKGVILLVCFYSISVPSPVTLAVNSTTSRVIFVATTKIRPPS